MFIKYENAYQNLDQFIFLNSKINLYLLLFHKKKEKNKSTQIQKVNGQSFLPKTKVSQNIRVHEAAIR